MTTNVAVIGCVDFSRHMFEVLARSDVIDIVAVVSRTKPGFNNDYFSLKNKAQAKRIPFLAANNNDQNKLEVFLRDKNIDIGLCLGWPYLLNNSILKIPKSGFVGYHPAKIPQNRGRHPLIWALTLGLTETASSFFLLDSRADGGPVLAQKNVKITSKDTARTLYQKMVRIAKRQLPEVINDLESGKKVPTRNVDALGNEWRKRSINDGIIDWRMSADAIQNLVRALSEPYPGALMRYKDTLFVVHKVKKGPKERDNIEPGKVLEIQNRAILVKCWKKSIWIIDHEMEDLPSVGEYFL